MKTSNLAVVTASIFTLATSVAFAQTHGGSNTDGTTGMSSNTGSSASMRSDNYNSDNNYSNDNRMQTPDNTTTINHDRSGNTNSAAANAADDATLHNPSIDARKKSAHHVVSHDNKSHMSRNDNYGTAYNNSNRY